MPTMCGQLGAGVERAAALVVDEHEAQAAARCCTASRRRACAAARSCPTRSCRRPGRAGRRGRGRGRRSRRPRRRSACAGDGIRRGASARRCRWRSAAPTPPAARRARRARAAGRRAVRIVRVDQPAQCIRRPWRRRDRCRARTADGKVLDVMSAIHRARPCVLARAVVGQVSSAVHTAGVARSAPTSTTRATRDSVAPRGDAARRCARRAARGCPS